MTATSLDLSQIKTDALSAASTFRSLIGLGTSAILNAGSANGVATLGADSKLTAAQIPDISLISYLGSVASQAAMLALSGQQGDWCVRSDLSTTWVITGSDPTLLANWTQLSYPSVPVQSVFGRTGAVVGVSTDYSSVGITNTPIGASNPSTGAFTTLTTTGNVGIGTASPQTLLDVNNVLNVSTTTSNPGSTGRVTIGKYSATLGGDNYGQLNLTNDNSSGFAILRFGFVGSGTGASFDIGAAGSSTISFGGNCCFLNTKNSSPIVFGINNSELVRLTTNGNFGIGSNSPPLKLTITGSGQRIASYIRNTSSSGYSELVFDNDNQYDANPNGSFVFGYGGTTTPNPNQGYFWNRRNAEILFGTNNTERMRITDTGNVGIGTTSPSAKLDVAGGTVTTSTPVLNLTQTWNASGTTFTGIFANVTDTASASGSLLMDLQVGGTSKFKVGKSGAATFSGNVTVSAVNVITDTTTGTKIGTATDQKIGFFNATPVVQQTAVADATDAASVITQLNALLSRLRTLGLIAT